MPITGHLPHRTELAEHAPLANDPVAEPIDEQVDNVGVPDAAIIWAIDRAQLADVAALAEKNADVFDGLSEAQIVVRQSAMTGAGMFVSRK
jgi:hypothetical protein